MEPDKEIDGNHIQIITSKLVSLKDYEKEAQSKLDPAFWKYISTGACYGETNAQNVEAYKRYYIMPRVLRDVSTVDTSTTLLGQKVSLPIGVSPSSRHRIAHPEAEAATGRGAMKSDVCMMLSIFSYKTMEEVDEACEGRGLRWMQLQPIHDNKVIIDIVQRAEKANYKAIVVTCDQPRGGVWYLKDNQVHPSPRNFSKEMIDMTFSSPGGYTKNFEKHMIHSGGTWDWIDWLRSVTSLPIVIKGILNPEDAKEAIKHDIQAIVVSNHGGRVLDGVPPTIDALPDIIEAVNGKVEVYVDGGIRVGTDVFKALALGARAVFVGRPIIWGLACNGEDGVHDVIQLIGKEFKVAMSSAGCRTTDEITSKSIRHISYYNNGPKILN